jgi:hypothetical protein
LGPFDYHRDFNLTYPLQLMLDISTSVGNKLVILPDTKIELEVHTNWIKTHRYLPNVDEVCYFIKLVVDFQTETSGK